MVQVGWPTVKLTLASPTAENTPTGQLNLAKEFLDAARASITSDAVVVRPTYWLISHAIELMLKAFLLHKRKSEAALRKPSVRHNLAELLKMALSLRLSIPDEVAEVVRGVSPAHKVFYFRYGGGYTPNVTVPSINDALVAAELVFGSVQNEVQVTR
jgi:hypothetical protein